MHSSGSLSFRIKKKISEWVEEDIYLPLCPILPNEATLTAPAETPAPKSPVPAPAPTKTPATNAPAGKQMGSRASAPIGNQKDVNTPRSIHSIRTTSIHGKKEEEARVIEKEEDDVLFINQPFTAEALLRSWNIFIETIKDDTHLINFMKTNPPVLMDDYQIELVVPNQVQEMKFQELTIPIERHLRHHLKNNKIRMTLRMAEEGENVRPFTSRDKLEAMIKKNPNMELLYRTLGLDIV